MSTPLHRRRLLQAAGAATLGLAWPLRVPAQTAGAVIRIGVAQPAVGNPPSFYGSSIAIGHAKGWIDDEFKAAGSRVEWLFFKGAGPAVNEALTNGQLDVAFQGDLPSIVGRAGGLKTRLVAAVGARANVYLAVPPDSPIRSVQDLRGKRVSIFKGTNAHLPIVRILEAHGLAERDIKAINLDTASAQAALTTRDIDAAFGGLDLLSLKNKGLARIAYTSKGGNPVYTRQSHLLVTEAFQAAQPAQVQRLVNALVRTARWASDDTNRDEIFRLWARTGYPYEVWKEDYDGEPLRVRFNPRFDPFMQARYRDAVQQAARFKLIRKPFDVGPWIDTRFLDAALREQKLASFWPEYQADGRIAGA
jgi:sulfonate transport system substrate-binding protein